MPEDSEAIVARGGDAQEGDTPGGDARGGDARGGDDAQEGDALRVGRRPAIYSIASAGRRGFPGARRHGAVYDEIAHWQPSSWF